MASRKITQLTELTAPASADVLPIVDVSEASPENQNKKITYAELLSSAPAGTAAAPAFAFDGDPDTGIYASAANELSVTTGGTERLRIDATGQIEAVSLGTAAAPTYTFTGDPNTGLYSPGADQVAISTAGTGRLFVDASGNIGLGMSSPLYRLDIDGVFSNPAARILRRGSYGEVFRIGRVGTGESVSFGYPNEGTLAIDTAGSERLRITASGLVGIGTSSPDALLTVNGVGAHGLGSAAAPSFAFTGDLNTGIYSPGADQVAISTGGTGRLFIDASGNVGVGATPAYSVAGGATLSIGSGAGNAEASIYSSTTGTGGVYFGDGAGAAAYAGFVEYNHASNFLRLATSGSERLRITSAGLVGIGTASPGANLTVQTAADAIAFRTETGPANPRFTVNNNSAGAIVDFYDSAGNIKTRIDARSNFPSYFTSGNVGIGTISPSYKLDLQVASDTTLAATADGIIVSGVVAGGNRPIGLLHTGNSYSYKGVGASRNVLYSNGPLAIQSDSGSIEFCSGSNLNAVLDSSGRLLVGTTTARSNFFNASVTSRLQVEGTTTTTSSISCVSNNASGNNAGIFLAKSNGAAVGSNTIVSNGDVLGGVYIQGSDGSEFVAAASITAEVDGGTGANDMPGRLVFSTTADGAASPQERMRITSDAYVRLASGTGGIQFNGDTAAANALDDYEEGTFTPTITGGTTAGTATYSAQVGNYTKIGRQVNFTIYIVWSGGTGTGELRITGLPFAVANLNSWAVSIGIADNVATAANTTMMAYAVQNGSYVTCRDQVIAGGANTATTYDAAGTLLITGSYAA